MYRIDSLLKETFICLCASWCVWLREWKIACYLSRHSGSNYFICKTHFISTYLVNVEFLDFLALNMMRYAESPIKKKDWPSTSPAPRRVPYKLVHFSDVNYGFRILPFPILQKFPIFLFDFNRKVLIPLRVSKDAAYMAVSFDWIDLEVCFFSELQGITDPSYCY